MNFLTHLEAILSLLTRYMSGYTMCISSEQCDKFAVKLEEYSTIRGEFPRTLNSYFLKVNKTCCIYHVCTEEIEEENNYRLLVKKINRIAIRFAGHQITCHWYPVHHYCVQIWKWNCIDEISLSQEPSRAFFRQPPHFSVMFKASNTKSNPSA